MVLSTSILVLVLAACMGLAEQGPSQEELACAALSDIRNLTITSAELGKVEESRAMRLGYGVVQYSFAPCALCQNKGRSTKRKPLLTPPGRNRCEI